MDASIALGERGRLLESQFEPARLLAGMHPWRKQSALFSRDKAALG
jgi:hypothetical protein